MNCEVGRWKNWNLSILQQSTSSSVSNERKLSLHLYRNFGSLAVLELHIFQGSIRKLMCLNFVWLNLCPKLQNSDNLEYNMLICWADGTNEFCNRALHLLSQMKENCRYICTLATQNSCHSSACCLSYILFFKEV